MNINKNLWIKCKICQKTIEELKKKYGGNNIYLTQVFKKHLEQDHDISIEQYFNIQELCPCGICNKKLGVKISGANFQIKKYACGRNSGVLNWSEKAKITRKGKNNPMYGANPWNKNYTKYDHPSIKRISDKHTGKTVSENTKNKQSIAAKNRITHGHTGIPHSEETKQKLRDNTLRMIREGKFKQNRTKPFLFCKQLLDRLDIQYQEEKIVDCWAFDFFIPIFNTYIEIDGDYFHSNPKIYPNGPKTNTQKINKYRDLKKNKYCEDNKIKLIRIWESDIFEFTPEKLLCILKK